jgi:hypothetical protein
MGGRFVEEEANYDGWGWPVLEKRRIQGVVQEDSGEQGYAA